MFAGESQSCLVYPHKHAFKASAVIVPRVSDGNQTGGEKESVIVNMALRL